MEVKHKVWFDKTTMQPLGPHLQKKFGGNPYVVNELFCYRTFLSTKTSTVELLELTKQELTILAKVAKMRYDQRQKGSA